MKGIRRERKENKKEVSKKWWGEDSREKREERERESVCVYKKVVRDRGQRENE